MTDVQDAALGIKGLGVSPIDVGRLAEPTPRDKIKQRAGPHSKFCDKPCSVQHPKLDYITARYVMERLDEIVGPEFWQSKHTMVGDKVQCSIGIKIDSEWVWKSDGAGETDIEGEKGSFSDALKRAAVSWGIARDLYPDSANHQGATVRPSTPAATDAGRVPPSTRPAPVSYDDQPYEGDSPPSCPVHRVTMVVSKYPDKTTGRIGWYCREKARDGEPANARGYCNQQVPG